MKGDFIVKFIEAFIETGKEIHTVWNWQPIYYKGTRISGPDVKRFRKSYKGIKNLEQRGIINQISAGRYKFTEKGRGWFTRYVARHPNFKKKKWDKKWRIVIFDIPEELHRNRNYFRIKLKYLGFFMLQKSVFVFPYPCEEELGDICRKLNLTDYVDVIKADSVGFREVEIRKYFDI